MIKKTMKSLLSLIICICVSISLFYISIFAADQTIMINGLIYGFNDYLKYNVNESQFRSDTGAGTFKINGNIDKVESDDVPKYIVKDGNLSFIYSPSKTYQNESEHEWHFADDNSKDVNGIVLPENIRKGTIFVQTSFDRNKWVTIKETIKTNIFSEETPLPSPFYATNDIQLMNGCYYRVIVAYKVTKKSFDKDILGNFKDLYKYYTEVYEFYAGYEVPTLKTYADSESYYLGKTEAVVVEDGFSTKVDMEKDDPHLGWDLGQFELKGFTKYNGESDGYAVFLKKVGDEILFQFKMNPDVDIDAISGKSNLSINDVASGYDRLLNVAPQKFGRGTFILRKTDYKGQTADPIIYTDFLDALAYPGADTKIKLLEEGDYEVTLDYEIANTDWFSRLHDYRMSFKFKIRNAETTVFPKDSVTGTYLGNNSVTPNGFVLDWA